ncbi:hypothetical protein [Zobellella taiwanensis]
MAALLLHGRRSLRPTRLAGLVLAALAFAPRAEDRVALSPSEQAYIAAHPEVSLCVDPDWWPFESIDRQGRHVGIAAEPVCIKMFL